jgi:hypothetical protein
MEDIVVREWMMDFDVIKTLAVNILLSGEIRFTVGNNVMIEKGQLAVVFHAEDVHEITIIQPYTFDGRNGVNYMKGSIRAGRDNMAFHKENIETVFQKVLGSFVDKYGPKTRRAKENQARHEAMLNQVVMDEGEVC